MRRLSVDIPTPAAEQVTYYLRKWDSFENYVLQESSLRKLFRVTYPQNTELDDILIKVCSLNDFYSTYIYSPFAVAKHIAGLRIDSRLAQNDFTVVNDIAAVPIKGANRNFYSFASKYCSHHKPIEYPIYDSYVQKMLVHFKSKDKFTLFTKNDLKDYPKYRAILNVFKQFYCLQRFTSKEIDQYLWLAGKQFFPKQY